MRYRVDHLSGRRWVRGVAGCSLGAAQRIAACVALARKAPARIVNAHGRVMVTITRAERGRYKVA